MDPTHHGHERPEHDERRALVPLPRDTPGLHRPRLHPEGAIRVPATLLVLAHPPHPGAQLVVDEREALRFVAELGCDGLDGRVVEEEPIECRRRSRRRALTILEGDQGG